MSSYETVGRLLTDRSLISDLGHAPHQKIKTTRHERRVKALAYMIEVCTGAGWGFTEEWARELLGLISDLLPSALSPEAKVSLERSEKRLRYMLEHPESLVRANKCIACDEVYYGDDHKCTNARARARDSIMGHDDTIM